MSTEAPARWDAVTYHAVSNPHVAWGSRVLARLSLSGDETVLDAGCGTGRLTALLAERLPRGRVVALDRDENMLADAREHLAPFGDRVSFVQASLLELPSALKVDAIFSTATLHWETDHETLFTELARVLRPGGRLVAQCGGGANLVRVTRRLDAVLAEPAFARFFAGVELPWLYADPGSTRDRLEQAGFVDVTAGLELAPTRFETEGEFRIFLEQVVLGQRLAPLTDLVLRQQVIDRLVATASQDTPPFELDYVRLNLSGRRA